MTGLVPRRHHDIANDLRHQIRTGSIKPGERLPSEAGLAARYRVSTVTLRRALAVLQGEGLVEKIHGKGNYVRHPRRKKALRMRRAQQVGDRTAAGELWQDAHSLVFTTKYGTPIEPGNLTRMFALRARRAGLRVIPLRNTRHTCSSLLVALKVHPKIAQRILRHSQIAMTMEVYAEASEEEVRAAIGKLSDAMGGTG